MDSPWDEVRKELAKIALSFAAAALIFQAVFYRESPLVVVRAVASFYWLFVLPGFAVLFHWRDRLDFLERFIMGTVLGLAAVVAIGYNLGVLGLHLKYQWLVVPLLVSAASVLFLLWRGKGRGRAENKKR